MTSGRRGRQQRVLLGWLALGLAAYALLPWYLPQNLTLWRSLGGVFGGSETEEGSVCKSVHICCFKLNYNYGLTLSK